jgi:hypothetical protein
MRLVAAITLAASMAAGCGGSSPSSPSKAPLPVAAETDHYVFHAAAGDRIDTAWQEAYPQWAVGRLGVQTGRKIGYYKYTSRQDMGDHTGSYNTNGYADIATFAIHTLFSTDNHEVVHLFMSLIGDPTALFAEGIAVAFQTDPVAGSFESRYAGEEVHASARRYLLAGQLVLPLDRIIESSGFRAIADTTLAYREAGSFVRFLIDRYGLEKVLAFFRSGGSYSDTAAAVKARFRPALGVTLEEAEAAWLEMLRGETPG